MAKRTRAVGERRCLCCGHRFTSHAGSTICQRCYKLKRWGTGKVLRLKAELDRLVKEVTRVQEWFRRNREG